MNSNDLFSFLNEAPPEVDEQEPGINDKNDMATGDHSEVPKKRKADDVGPPPSNGANVYINEDNEAGPSEPKKLRVSSPKPMVTDEVEIEAKREVEASAGLQDSKVAGSRLELRHQVCNNPLLCSKSAQIIFTFVGSPSSCSATWLSLHSYCQPCTSRETSARI
jgi:ATP-dependent RNA helicase DOB1